MFSEAIHCRDTQTVRFAIYPDGIDGPRIIARISDDALMFQDRITGMLDAHLSNVSFRLNEVMKVLTIVTVLFMPPTLVAGIWGMNVQLPHFPGGEAAQFWWVVGGVAGITAVMLMFFRARRWI